MAFRPDRGAVESPAMHTIRQSPALLFSSPPFQLLAPTATAIANSFLPPTPKERLNASLLILQLSCLSHPPGPLPPARPASPRRRPPPREAACPRRLALPCLGCAEHGCCGGCCVSSSAPALSPAAVVNVPHDWKWFHFSAQHL